MPLEGVQADDARAVANKEKDEMACNEDNRSHPRSEFIHNLASPRLLLVVKEQIVIVSASNSFGRYNEVDSEIHSHPHKVASQRINEEFVKVKACVDRHKLTLGFWKLFFLRHCCPSQVPHHDDWENV